VPGIRDLVPDVELQELLRWFELFGRQAVIERDWDCLTISVF